jgi:hypothetical protein
MKEWIVGLLKSWTVWAGVVLMAFPEWWPLAEPYVRQIVSPEHYTKLMPIVGIAMVLLRLKTKESITEKGL